MLGLQLYFLGAHSPSDLSQFLDLKLVALSKQMALLVAVKTSGSLPSFDSQCVTFFSLSSHEAGEMEVITMLPILQRR